MTITFGDCGHAISDHVSQRDDMILMLARGCRVCARSGRHSMCADGYGPGTAIAVVDGEDVARVDAHAREFLRWRGRESEANACDEPEAPVRFGHLDEVHGRFYALRLGDLDDDAATVRYLLSQGSMRLNPRRMTADFVEVPELAFLSDPPDILRDDRDVETGSVHARVGTAHLRAVRARTPR